jgi:hypothetical protein
VLFGVLAAVAFVYGLAVRRRIPSAAHETIEERLADAGAAAVEP